MCGDNENLELFMYSCKELNDLEDDILGLGEGEGMDGGNMGEQLPSRY